MKKIRHLEEFSPEARQAIEARKVEGSWEYRKLVKLLSEFEQFDAVNRQAIERRNNIVICCLISVVVSIVAVYNLGGWTWLALIAAAGVFLYFWMILPSPEERDLIDDFWLCLIPALKDLQYDIAPDRKIKIRMDLSGRVDSKAGETKKLPDTPWVSETAYTDDWCDVRLPLVDGSTSVLNFHTEWLKKEKSRTKISRRRGRRTETKTSWRKNCSVTASLIPNSDREWNERVLNESIDGSRERAQVVNRDGVRVGRIERYWKFKWKYNYEPPKSEPSPREVVGMLLRLHAAMGLSPEAKS